MAMFRDAKKVEEEKPAGNPDENNNVEIILEHLKQIMPRGGITLTRGRLTADDIVTVDNLLNPHPVSAVQSGSWTISNLLNPHPVSLSTLLNPHPVTQTTRANMTVKPEREDLTSLGGVVSPNNAGVLIVSGTSGQYVKVFDAGYHPAVAGLHYFYFGTSTSATTKRFCTNSDAYLIHKTFVHPRVGADGDSLYLFSAVAETNMPYDVGYVKE